jgi:hypothetical protein
LSRSDIPPQRFYERSVLHSSAEVSRCARARSHRECPKPPPSRDLPGDPLPCISRSSAVAVCGAMLSRAASAFGVSTGARSSASSVVGQAGAAIGVGENPPAVAWQSADKPRVSAAKRFPRRGTPVHASALPWRFAAFVEESAEPRTQKSRSPPQGRAAKSLRADLVGAA